MKFPGNDFSVDRQMWWLTGRWRPNSRLHSLFRQVGRSEHGERLLEYWGADDAEGGLDHRQWFIDWEEERWPTEE